MLTKKVPVLRNIVAFGSPCTGHQDAKIVSLGARGKQGVIIGKSDKLKGNVSLFHEDKVVVATFMILSLSMVGTLTKKQRHQLRRVHLKKVDKAACDSLTTKENKLGHVHYLMRRNHSRVSGWTREAHVI